MSKNRFDPSKIGFLFFILFHLCWNVDAYSSDPDSLSAAVPLGGRLFSDFYVPSKNILHNPLQQVSASAWLQIDPKLGENSSGHLTLTANQVEASVVSGRTGFQTGIREAQLSYFKNGWEVQAGKMIIPWGNSDGFNPTDFLSAKDYTFFNPDDEVRRIGATGLLVTWTPDRGQSPFTLTAVVLPVFAQSRLLLAPGQLPATLKMAVESPVSPVTKLEQASWALKTKVNGNYWDISILGYSGWNSLPGLQVTGISGSPAAPSLNAAFTFQRYRALGTEGALTFGKWIIKTEDAYVWTENNDGQNPPIQPSYLGSVVSVERPIGGGFRAQAQGLMRYYPNCLSPSSISDPSPLNAAANQQVALANALIQNYQDQFRPAGTLRLSYSDEQNGIDAQIFFVMNFKGGDYLFRPKADYSVSDSLKITLGMDYYAGPAGRPFGILAPFSSVYSEFKYLF